MKLRYIVLFLFLVSAVFAQKQRFLVSPNQEVIPLTKEQTASRVLAQKARAKAVASAGAVCSNQATFGYSEDEYPVGFNFGGYHKDVLGQWYQAKAAGTIDTLFWEGFGLVGAADSLIYIRVHKSILGPTYGPGVRPGPFNPPCQNWGYWKNSNDLDQGVAAFIEEAAQDTSDHSDSWVSTINRSTTPSGPPFAEELWGLGGFPQTMRGDGSINHVSINDLYPLNVEIGDLFFVSMRVNAPASPVSGHPTYTEDRTEWSMWGDRVETTNENYPARDWKFYEHDKGPSGCFSGTPITIDSIRRGWVARGGLTTGGDSLDVGAYNWWYTMTVTTNVPPVVSYTSPLSNTFSNDEYCVDINATDCNPADPSSAGIANMYISWSLNGNAQSPISCENLGGDAWQGCIPGQPAPSTISWSLTVCDSQGQCRTIPKPSFRVISLINEYFVVDASGSGCTNSDIRSTGKLVDPSNFKLFWRQDTAGAVANVWDDGTAGPYDLGGTFNMFGKALRYAWIGVNGAIALTETATETTHVNSVGSYTTGWDLPGTYRSSSIDTEAVGRKPAVFIAPMWADWYYRDTGASGSLYGRMLWDTIGCRTIFEWDSVGVFNANGDPIVDEDQFRVVLNRCDGTIEFQYDNVGAAGQDTSAMIGIGLDSLPDLANNSPFVFIYRYGGPPETQPANGSCFRIYQGAATLVNDKWNLVSVARDPYDAVLAKSSVFPTATSQAFKYSGSYTSEDPLVVGTGYWLKFNSQQLVGKAGTEVKTVAQNVVADWNLLGTISSPVPVSSINDAPVNGQSWFGFTNGYTSVSTLTPGHAYWVKGLSAGTVNINAVDPSAAPKSVPLTSNLNAFSKITISGNGGGQQTLYVGNAQALKVSLAKFELPPTPPEGAFDARFSSNRFVETYNNEDAKTGEYVIKIQSASYPVIVRWDVVKDKGYSLVISDNATGKSLGRTILNNSGFVRITDPSVTSLRLKVVDEIQVPLTFALSQNYPNPFNPVTRFQIDIPASNEDVNVAVFDVLGRQVATLLTGQQEPGYHTIEWDGHDSHGVNSPSGMYFVRMTAGDFTSVRKIMLLK